MTTRNLARQYQRTVRVAGTGLITAVVSPLDDLMLPRRKSAKRGKEQPPAK